MLSSGISCDKLFLPHNTAPTVETLPAPRCRLGAGRHRGRFAGCLALLGWKGRGKELGPFPETSEELDSSTNAANWPAFILPISHGARAVSGVSRPPDPDQGLCAFTSPSLMASPAGAQSNFKLWLSVQTYENTSYLTTRMVWPCLPTFLRGGAAAGAGRLWAGRLPLRGPGQVRGCLAAPAEAGCCFPGPQAFALQGKPGQRDGVAFPARAEELGCWNSQGCSYSRCSMLLSRLRGDLLKDLKTLSTADLKVC